MACGFTVKDVFVHRVTLTHRNLQAHLPRHPEVAPYQALLPLVLRAPAYVIEAERDGHYHFYRRELPSVRFQRVWLRVVVPYAARPRHVATFWLSRKIDPGVQRWPKP
jgi:hypothetical protein